MKLAISNIGFAPQDDSRVLRWMQELGYAGLEIAPTRLTGPQPYRDLPRAARAAQDVRRQYGLSIVSMQSIWYGQTGNLFCAADAPHLADYTCRAVDYAQAVGCPSLVFGNPRQRSVPPGASPDEALGFFARISAYARQRGAVIALEANPAVYGTNFCNTSAEAFAFARRVPGLRVNYDLGTLLTNGEALGTLFDNLALVSHIHLSEPQLAPVRPRPEHRALAEGLRCAGYSGFVSVEMKTQPADTVRRVLEYAAEVFA